MHMEREYLMGIGPIPLRQLALSEKENFKPIKDEIRDAVWISEKINLHPEPRVSIRNGLAWFEVEDYDDALMTYEILQGRYWKKEGIVLDAYIFRQDERKLGQLEQLCGPIDGTTGQMLLAPVPRSPPVAPTTHAQTGHMVQMRSHPTRFQHAHTGSIHYGPKRGNVWALPAGPSPIADPFDQSIRGPADAPTANTGVGCPRPRQSVQVSPMIPVTPNFSSSSRNSSISTLPTTTLTPNISTFFTTAANSTSSSALNTPPGSWDPSLSKVSIASTIPRIYGPIPTPSPSVSEHASEFPSPAPVREHYKVTIRNLSQDATKERLYRLIEEKTHAFVQMTQPDYITLRHVHGQIHAYVKFVREKDAEKAVRQLHRCIFMGRSLQTTLG